MPPVSFKTFVQGSTAASTPLGGTEQIVIIQGNAVVQCVADDLGGGGGGASYLVYTALLSQSDTDNPTAIVLQNTLGGAVVWTRIDVGVFRGTLTGAFVEDKTFAIVSNTAAFSTLIFRVDADEIEINPADNTNTPIDNGLSSTSIEIRVYP